MTPEQTTQLIEAVKTWNINVESESGRLAVEMLASNARELGELYLWLQFVGDVIGTLALMLGLSVPVIVIARYVYKDGKEKREMELKK